MHLQFKLAVFLFFFSLQIISAQSDKAVASVVATLHQQAEDWSEGDIDAFMASYWQSEKLQFIGSEGVTFGWQKTIDGYKKRYPDKATMGHLTFEVLNTEKRSRKVITLIGRYHLKREAGDLEGVFLLVWKKIKGNWLIVADQTCG